MPAQLRARDTFFCCQIAEHNKITIEGDLMKQNAVGLFSVALMLVSFSALQATVFDGAGTPVTLETFGDAPGPSIEATGGNPDGYLRIRDRRRAGVARLREFVRVEN